ncbi:MAG: calcium/sodium antiporter [Rhodospirillaceae bacterium]|nr:calcium/sodium antiporter [Rhodospirillaceae bacterium]
MTYVQLAIGCVLLLGGAEIMVRGAVQIATRLGLSPLLIGMTVVAFGTSAPELVVSLNAAFSGTSGIALGNVVGSNIANILLILGATCLVAPVMVDPKAVLRDGIMLLVASVFFVWVSLLGYIGSFVGSIMVISLIAYFVRSYFLERNDGTASAKLHERETEEFKDIKINIWLAWGFFVVGLGGVIYGADLLVHSGSEIARNLGVSEEVIGLTVIAIGTSLPELAASVVAALRGHTDVAIGNIVGSNLFNILLVGGGVAAVHPLDVPEQIQRFDIWVMLAATIMLFAYLVLGRRFRRREGTVLLGAYGGYVALQAHGVSNFYQWLP